MCSRQLFIQSVKNQYKFSILICRSRILKPVEHDKLTFTQTLMKLIMMKLFRILATTKLDVLGVKWNLSLFQFLSQSPITKNQPSFSSIRSCSRAIMPIPLYYANSFSSKKLTIWSSRLPQCPKICSTIMSKLRSARRAIKSIFGSGFLTSKIGELISFFF